MDSCMHMRQLGQAAAFAQAQGYGAPRECRHLSY